MQPNTQKTTLFGGLIAAFLASICCIGPVIFGVLGLTGVGFISKFDSYRPYLIGATLIMLATAGYFTYRKEETCSTDAMCANPKADKWNKIIFWSVTLIAFIFLFAPTLLSWIL